MVKCPSKLVDLTVTPRETYEDPLAPFFDDSRVERRIDRMLDCDTLVDEEGLSNYDIQKMQQFKDGIEIRNKQVYVDLVWHDNLSEVPSNHQVALKGTVCCQFRMIWFCWSY